MMTGKGIKGSSPSARNWERSAIKSAAPLTIPSTGLGRRIETTHQTDLGRRRSPPYLDLNVASVFFNLDMNI